jgi:hypothetical protein
LCLRNSISICEIAGASERKGACSEEDPHVRIRDALRIRHSKVLATRINPISLDMCVARKLPYSVWYPEELKSAKGSFH